MKKVDPRSLLDSWMIPVLFALLEGLTHFGIWWGDSAAYVDTLKFLRGTASAQAAKWHGILRPVVLVLALPLSYVTSDRYAIAFVNLGFFLLGTFFMYLFTKKLLNKKVAFLSAILFASAAPSLMFGTAVLTDGPAYAMQIVLLYCILFILEEKQDSKTSILMGILIGVGILTKETSVTVLVFLLIRFFLHRDRMTMRNLFMVALVSMAIPLLWSRLVNYSYLGFYGEGLAYQQRSQEGLAYWGYKGLLVNPKIFVLSVVYAFYLCLPFAFLAFFSVDDNSFKTFCEILLSVGVILTLWPTGPETRFTFLTSPAVLPLAAYGMSQASEILGSKPGFRLVGKKSWLRIIVLAAIVYTNYVTFKTYFKTP